MTVVREMIKEYTGGVRAAIINETPRSFTTKRKPDIYGNGL